MQYSTLDEMTVSVQQLVHRIIPLLDSEDAIGAGALVTEIAGHFVLDGEQAVWRVDQTKLVLEQDPVIYFTRTAAGSELEQAAGPELFLPTTSALESGFSGSPEMAIDTFPIAQEMHDGGGSFPFATPDDTVASFESADAFPNYDSAFDDSSSFFGTPEPVLGLDEAHAEPSGTALDKVVDWARQNTKLVGVVGVCLLVLVGLRLFGGDDTSATTEVAVTDTTTSTSTTTVASTTTSTLPEADLSINPYGCGELPTSIEGNAEIAFIVNATIADVNNLECLDTWEVNGLQSPKTAIRFVDVINVDATTGEAITDPATPSVRQAVFRGQDTLSTADLAYSSYQLSLALGAESLTGVAVLPDSGGENGGYEVSAAVAAGIMAERIWTEDVTREKALEVLDMLLRTHQNEWYAAVPRLTVDGSLTPSEDAARAARRLAGAGVLVEAPVAAGFFADTITVQEWTSWIARVTIGTRIGEKVLLDELGSASVVDPANPFESPTPPSLGDVGTTSDVATAPAPTPATTEGLLAALASGDTERAAAALTSVPTNAALVTASLSGLDGAGFTMSAGAPAPIDDGLYSVRVELIDAGGAVVGSDVLELAYGSDGIWRATGFPEFVA